jgi:hypothetical protein
MVYFVCNSIKNFPKLQPHGKIPLFLTYMACMQPIRKGLIGYMPLNVGLQVAESSEPHHMCVYTARNTRIMTSI